MGLRSVYVRASRWLRRRLERRGTLERWARSDRAALRHLRTMVAIHDVEDLSALDLPWWTYRAIDRVERVLAGGQARVFEFGSGASTLWLARRAASVDSVEHDVGFAAIVEGMLADTPNVTLRSRPGTRVSGEPTTPSRRRGHEELDFTDYVATIDEVGGEFDLITIDGRARTACLERALAHLAPGGLIVFDDVHRHRYRDARRRDDAVVEVLAGAKPCLPYPSSTALVRPREVPSSS